MKKSILFVINTLGRGGAEAALIAMLELIDQDKYDIDLYVMVGQGDLIHKVPDYVKVLNKKFDDHDVLDKAGKKRLIWHLFEELLHVGSLTKNLPNIISNYRIMKKNNRVLYDKLLWRTISDSAPHFEKHYDLAVAYLEGASTYYVSDYVKADKKACFVHIDYEMSGYTRELDKGCFGNMDKIFTVSDEVKDAFLRVYPEYEDKTEVSYNIVNSEKIKERSEEPGGFEDSFDGRRILTVARLNQQKALDVSIRAMKILLEKGYPLRWYVLGEGDQRNMLESLIRSLGMKEDFLLLGTRDNPFPYYRQCDLYVHCSRFEGRSIAIQEAQILGCPIIVSDCPGNRQQVIDKVNGLLVPFDEASIADAIEGLLNNTEFAKELGDNAALINNNSEDLPKLLNLIGEST